MQLQLTYLYSYTYHVRIYTLYIYTFLNPPNSILLVLKSAKCLRREEKTHTNRTSVYVIHKTSLRRWCVAKRSVKKSFSIRGINAQTDTGLCVRYIYVIRVCVHRVIIRFGTAGPKTRTHEYPFTCIAL